MSGRVLITGVTGYLGSNLARALVADGYEVFALKRKASRLNRIESFMQRIALYDLDDLSFTSLFQQIGKLDAVIHLATCYGRNGESASQIFESNTLFPLELLEAAAKAGVAAFVNAGTSLDKQLNPYALSKSQFLEWGRYFAGKKAIHFLNTRLEHFYGPGDDDSKFTTHVIKACLANAGDLKLTLGEQSRDFVFVDDVVDAFRLFLSKEAALANWFSEFDVGSGTAISIREFVETVHRLTNSSTRLVFGAMPYREGEVMFARANTDRLCELGWHNQHSLEQGLKRTIGTVQ